MRVLILSATTGGGHMRAANALKEYILSKDEKSAVEILDTIEYVSPFLNKAVTNGYVVVYKKQGVDSLQKKIDKPAITPIQANRDMKSAFVQAIQDSEVEPIHPRFVDFEKDLTVAKTKKGLPLYYVANNTNGLFELFFRYDFGKSADNRYSVAADYLDFLGTEKLSATEVRQKFTALLEDIRDKCCRNQYFRSAQGRRISDCIFEKYHSVPEFLWPNIPSYAAFRRSGSKKWFAVIGSVPRRKVDPASSPERDVEVINVKVDSAEIKEILSRDGYYPAFHMNKICWVPIILDDTLSDEEIRERVSDSFQNI